MMLLSTIFAAAVVTLATCSDDAAAVQCKAGEDGVCTAEQGSTGLLQASQDLARVRALLGAPRSRDDVWLQATAAFLRSSNEPEEAKAHVTKAADLMRLPVAHRRLRSAWDELSLAVAVAPSSLEILQLKAHFAWQYYQALSFLTQAEVQSCMAPIAEVPSAAKVLAGLTVSHNVSALAKAVEIMQAATAALPADQDLAYHLGVALRRMGRGAEAVQVMIKHHKCTKKKKAHPELLATLGHLLTSTQHNETKIDVFETMNENLKCAMRSKGTQGAVIAKVFGDCQGGEIDIEHCERLYTLAWELLSTPSDCMKLLEFGSVLRRMEVPLAVARGKKILSSLAFDCPALAEKLTGTGQQWLKEPISQKGSAGLGADLPSYADVRAGTQDAMYADWYDGVSSGNAEEVVHLLPRFSSLVQTHEQAQHLSKPATTIPRSCLASNTSSEVHEHIVRPSNQDELGCPKISFKQFDKECRKKRRPCVVEAQGKEFLAPSAKGLKGILNSLVELSGNATVKVCFASKTTDKAGAPATFMSIRNTAEFFAAEGNRAELQRLNITAPDASELPWTLVQPPCMNMLLRDAVTWARKHRQEIYIHQHLLVDLGDAATELIRTPGWATKAGLRMTSPSLSLTSGALVTGYTYDASESLVVQVAGAKEVSMLRPAAVKSLQYMKVADAATGSELTAEGTVEVRGLTKASRMDRVHSIIDVASPSIAEEFPRYAQASSVTCQLGAGDALYVPSYWHHSEVTRPDDKCIGLSIHFEYTSKKPLSFEDAVVRSGGSAEDVKDLK